MIRARKAYISSDVCPPIELFNQQKQPLVMKFSSIVCALTAAVSVIAAPVSSGSNNTNKTILLTNDDGWASTNIRATYKNLKNAGYEVIMVAPVSQRSGFGGQFLLPTTKNLTTGGEFNYPPAGSPSWDHEKDDMNIWYFNGTPSSCVAFALNYIMPKYYNNKTVDLVVSGPNEGTNMSPGLYTLSGTMGATYSAVNRGIPAIAFSGSNSNNSFYKDDVSKENDKTFTPNILAKKVVQLVDALFASYHNHPNMLPVTTGLNVNFGPVGADCMDPEYVFTRLDGPDSMTPSLAMNQTTGLPVWSFGYYPATFTCVFGDCDLPSEAWLITEKTCKASVSLFSIDYDADYKQASRVQSYLAPVLN